MKGFLYRDLCEMKRLSKFVAIILVCFGVIAFMGKSYTIQVMLPIYCILMFVNQIMNEDEKSGWVAFVSVIPNGRRNMVKSKYVALLLVTGTVLLLETLLSVGLAVTGGQELLFSLQVALVAVGISVLMAEITLPLKYSFGVEAGGILSIVCVVMLILLLVQIAVETTLNFLIVVPITGTVAFYPSYRASVSACEGREF